MFEDGFPSIKYPYKTSPNDTNLACHYFARALYYAGDYSTSQSVKDYGLQGQKVSKSWLTVVYEKMVKKTIFTLEKHMKEWDQLWFDLFQHLENMEGHLVVATVHAAIQQLCTLAFFSSMIFDSMERFALRFTKENLEHCLSGEKFLHVTQPIVFVIKGTTETGRKNENGKQPINVVVNYNYS